MHERISINAACFPHESWRDVDRAWQDLGAGRVGYVGMLLQSDPVGARAVLGQGRYLLETVVHPFMLGHQLDASPAAIAAQQEALSQTIRLVAELGGKSVFVATGGRGALTWEQAADAFCAAVAPCRAEAERVGIALLVENTPTLYAHLNIALSLRDTVMLAERANLGICLDFFSCWTEAGLRETMDRAMPRCGVIQLADYVLGDRSLPARAVPGDGAIPLRRLCEWALDAGYSGAFDLELIGPRIDTEGNIAATRRAAHALEATLRELGV